MTAALAGVLRNQFPALIGAHLLIWFGIAGFAYATGGTVLVSLCIAAGGLLATLLVFGLLALSVENSRLLMRIADATERQGRGGDRPVDRGAAAVIAPVPTAPPSPQAPAIRRAQAAAGRMEPVVTLRGSNALPGL
ncbi:hypothetical protein [Gemmobacter serpentinus]|uniref:hypothetical protein n=1 Tax=Gemmobacter serpentinus TaxID=2652247 RepID=UPI00124C133E|nr:hypothetical protein [Gemmobacter serpentinus]